MNILTLLAAVLLGSFAANAQIQSVYTSTKEKDCRKLATSAAEGVLYTAVCKGAGRFKVKILGTDHTTTIELIGVDGKDLDVNIRGAVASAAPSGVGDKLEWRIRKRGKMVEPFALIVRINLFTAPDDSNKIESHLAVVRLKANEGCVVGVVGPATGQNAAARKLADESAAKPCIGT